MEILGIVWAASILCPASAAKSTKDICLQPEFLQEFLPFPGNDGERQSSRSDSLVKLATLAASTTDAAASTDSALLMSDVTADTKLQEPVANQHQFQTLVPAIGITLTGFEPTIATSGTTPIAMSTSSDSFYPEWHSWSAVAAVRVEPVAEVREVSVASQVHGLCLQTAEAPYQPSALAMKSSPKSQVWVHNQFIGAVSGQVAAQKIAYRLRSLVQSGQLDPTQLKPLIGSNFVGIGHHNDVLFLLDETFQPHPEVPATLTAIQWINNLRLAFDEAPLEPVDIQMALENLVETSETIYGTASWYGPGFHGRRTANGEIFNENALTAAHKTLPFNTRLKVTNRMSGQSVVVRINDRGPYVGQRSLDLSKAAAHCLGSAQRGVIPYEAVILDTVPQPDLDELTTAQLPTN
ncbi:MAG: septal ring lytic transglycosylase RlpA family protein [Leptolyngbyaceae cyanobacterium]